MNPLQKTLLGVLTGLVLALLTIRESEPAVLGMGIIVSSCYSIGFIYGWKVMLSCAEKALHIGTDLTLWLLLVCLFRRGWLFGFVFLICIFSFAVGAGFVFGFFVGVKETVKYILTSKESWIQGHIFPRTDSDAYLLIAGWFAKYNEQNIDEESLHVLSVCFDEEIPDMDSVRVSIDNNNLNELYLAFNRYRAASENKNTEQKVLRLFSTLLLLVRTRGSVTCQAREFLLLLAECSRLTWKDVMEYYRLVTGSFFPEAQDPSLLFEKNTVIRSRYDRHYVLSGFLRILIWDRRTQLQYFSGHTTGKRSSITPTRIPEKMESL